MAGELLLTMDVVCQDPCEVHGMTRNIVVIPFTGRATGRLFSGEIQPFSADTQTTQKDKLTVQSARYLIRGKDYTGRECRVFVEIQGDVMNGYSPVITTDSPALADWETDPLTAKLEEVPGGVRVIIRKADAQFFRKPNWINEDYTAEDSELRRRLISFRTCWTGITFYDLYDGEELICRASRHVLPSAPVNMTDDTGVQWTSDFDMETTIMPGVAREVLDEETGELVARLVYNGGSHFVLNGNIDIYCEDRFYVFFWESKEIAIIRPVEPESIRRPETLEEEAEPYYEVCVHEDLKPDILRIVHAFPLLRFFL